MVAIGRIAVPLAVLALGACAGIELRGFEVGALGDVHVANFPSTEMDRCRRDVDVTNRLANGKSMFYV